MEVNGTVTGQDITRYLKYFPKYVRYINILTWLRSFQVKIVFFLSSFCLPIPKRDLDTKKRTPDIEVWPESLGAMLEYWYIESGLLVTENETVVYLELERQLCTYDEEVSRE